MSELALQEQQTLNFDGGGFVTLNDTGITLDESMTYSQWKHGLAMFDWFRKRLKIGLSDYLEWGRAKFGVEMCNEAMAQLELDLPMVKSAIAIGKVPAALRHSNLTGEHYAVLAKKKDHPKLAEWAATAARDNMTPTQLKASMEAGSPVNGATARQLNCGIISVQGLAGEFAIWSRRVGGVDGVMKMPEGDIQEIESELAEIIDFGIELRARRAAQA